MRVVKVALTINKPRTWLTADATTATTRQDLERSNDYTFS